MVMDILIGVQEHDDILVALGVLDKLSLKG